MNLIISEREKENIKQQKKKKKINVVNMQIIE